MENEKLNPRKWAEENLSAPRARAFKNALRELEDKKFSSEFWEARNNEDKMRREFALSKREETDEIQRKAHQKSEELEKQAKLLMIQASKVRDEAREEVSRIISGVYETEEYKAENAKASELWHKDDAIFQTKVLALMEKYQEAQAKSA